LINNEIDKTIMDSSSFSMKKSYLNAFKLGEFKQKVVRDIDVNVVNNIVNENYTKKQHMNMLYSLVNDFIETICILDKGLYIIYKDSDICIKNKSILVAVEDEKNIYKANLLDDNIFIILKNPIKVSKNDHREFIIGKKVLNNMRMYVPTFVYTFGCYKTPTTGFNIMLENIEGYTLSKLLKKNLPFENILEIIVQILLSLEIAQDKYHFTHFDLHTSNIMIKNVKDITYTVLLDDTKYDITTSYLPVIIDFEATTVKINNKTSGLGSFPEYGMVDYMIQGQDYAKLLTDIYKSCNNIKDKLLVGELFNIFNNHYLKVPTDDPRHEQYSTGKFVMEGSFTEIAKYTPKEILLWIYKHEKYVKILQDKIKISLRDIFCNIDYQRLYYYGHLIKSTVKDKRPITCNKAFLDTKLCSVSEHHELSHLIDEISMESISISYIDCSTCIFILSETTNGNGIKDVPSLKPSPICVASGSIKDGTSLAISSRAQRAKPAPICVARGERFIITKLEEYIKEKYIDLMENDIEKFTFCFNIQIPTQEDIEKECNYLLNINVMDIIKENISYTVCIDNYNKIKNVKELIYKIKQAGIKEFYYHVLKFEKLPIHDIYNKNSLLIEKAHRWYESKKDFSNLITQNPLNNLNTAIGQNDIVLLKYLLFELHVDPTNNKDIIRLAVQTNNIEMIKLLLLDKRIDPNGGRIYPIILASRKGYIEIFKLLLADSRVDPSTNDNQCICFASLNGHYEVVKLLLADSRVEPSTICINNASINGHYKVMKLLLADSRVDPSVHSNNALLRAIQYGHYEVVKLLLADSRVDPSANDNEGIRGSCEFGFLEIVKLLLDDPRVDPTANNNSALILASCNGHVNIVKLLWSDHRVSKKFNEIIKRLPQNERSECAHGTKCSAKISQNERCE